MIADSILRRTRWVAGMCVVLLAAGCERDEAGQAPAATEEIGGGAAMTPAEAEAAADEMIGNLSQRLGAAKTFTFTAERHLDPGLLPGRNIAEDARIEAFVKRPNKVYAVARTDTTVRHFYFDGQKVTVYDETKNMYGVAEVPGTIDDMVAQLDERYGFTPPLAEFIVSDIDGYVDNQVESKRVVGTTNVNGMPCTRIAFTGEHADGEVWLSTDNQLPCGLQAAFKDIANSPQVRVTFANWNLNAPLDDAKFTFNPPSGSQQIRMLTQEEL